MSEKNNLGNMVKCRECNKTCNFKKAIKIELDKQTYWFCSLECAEKYEKAHFTDLE